MPPQPLTLRAADRRGARRPGRAARPRRVVGDRRARRVAHEPRQGPGAAGGRAAGSAGSRAVAPESDAEAAHPTAGGGDPPGDDAPVTKRDLVRYLALIAPVLLPHLAGRALNLARYPDGIGGEFFWQKDVARGTPDWVTRWREPDPPDRRPHAYVVADSLATLAWLGNQAALEIHPWTSLIEAPGEPRWALVDIDPGERTTWDETLAIARLFRRAFEHLGVTGVPKVTGKRGVQVFVPLRPGYTFEETRAWVEQVSRAVGADRPGPGQLGVVEGPARRPRAPRLHPELAEPDPRGALLAAAGTRPAGVRADHLGRAGRPGAPAGSLDDPDDPAPTGGARRPVRRRAGPGPGAAEALIREAGSRGPDPPGHEAAPSRSDPWTPAWIRGETRGWPCLRACPWLDLVGWADSRRAMGPDPSGSGRARSTARPAPRAGLAQRARPQARLEPRPGCRSVSVRARTGSGPDGPLRCRRGDTWPLTPCPPALPRARPAP